MTTLMKAFLAVAPHLFFNFQSLAAQFVNFILVLRVILVGKLGGQFQFFLHRFFQFLDMTFPEEMARDEGF